MQQTTTLTLKTKTNCWAQFQHQLSLWSLINNLNEVNKHYSSGNLIEWTTITNRNRISQQQNCKQHIISVQPQQQHSKKTKQRWRHSHKWKTKKRTWNVRTNTCWNIQTRPSEQQSSISALPCRQSRQRQGKGTIRSADCWKWKCEPVSTNTPTRTRNSQMIFNKQRSPQTKQSTQPEPDLMETQPDNSSNLNSASNQIEQVCSEQPSKDQMPPIISLVEKTMHSSPSHRVDEHDTKIIGLSLKKTKGLRNKMDGQLLNIKKPSAPVITIPTMESGKSVWESNYHDNWEADCRRWNCFPLSRGDQNRQLLSVRLQCCSERVSCGWCEASLGKADIKEDLSTKVNTFFIALVTEIKPHQSQKINFDCLLWQKTRENEIKEGNSLWGNGNMVHKSSFLFQQHIFIGGGDFNAEHPLLSSTNLDNGTVRRTKAGKVITDLLKSFENTDSLGNDPSKPTRFGWARREKHSTQLNKMSPKTQLQKIVQKAMMNNTETTNPTVHHVNMPNHSPKTVCVENWNSSTWLDSRHSSTRMSSSYHPKHVIKSLKKSGKRKKVKTKPNKQSSRERETGIESEMWHDDIDDSNSDSNFSDDHHYELEEHKFCDNNTLSQNKKQRAEDRDTIIDFTFVSSIIADKARNTWSTGEHFTSDHASILVRNRAAKWWQPPTWSGRNMWNLKKNKNKMENRKESAETPTSRTHLDRTQRKWLVLRPEYILRIDKNPKPQETTTEQDVHFIEPDQSLLILTRYGISSTTPWHLWHVVWCDQQEVWGHQWKRAWSWSNCKTTSTIIVEAAQKIKVFWKIKPADNSQKQKKKRKLAQWMWKSLAETKALWEKTENLSKNWQTKRETKYQTHKTCTNKGRKGEKVDQSQLLTEICHNNSQMAKWLVNQKLYKQKGSGTNQPEIPEIFSNRQKSKAELISHLKLTLIFHPRPCAKNKTGWIGELKRMSNPPKPLAYNWWSQSKQCTNQPINQTKNNNCSMRNTRRKKKKMSQTSRLQKHKLTCSNNSTRLSVAPGMWGKQQNVGKLMILCRTSSTMMSNTVDTHKSPDASCHSDQNYQTSQPKQPKETLQKGLWLEWQMRKNQKDKSNLSFNIKKLKEKQQNNCDYANKIQSQCIERNQLTTKLRREIVQAKRDSWSTCPSQMGEKRSNNQPILSAKQVWNRFKTINHSSSHNCNGGKRCNLGSPWKSKLLAEQNGKVRGQKTHLQLNWDFKSLWKSKNLWTMCSENPTTSPVMHSKTMFSRRTEKLGIHSLLQIEELHSALNTTGNYSAPGTDSVNYKLIKHSSIDLEHLVNLVNDSLEKKGYFPKQWKWAKIIPIPKNERAHLPKHYRPIHCHPVSQKKLKNDCKKILLWSRNTQEQERFRPKNQLKDNLFVWLQSHTIHWGNTKRCTDYLWCPKSFWLCLSCGLLFKIHQLFGKPLSPQHWRGFAFLLLKRKI